MLGSMRAVAGVAGIAQAQFTDRDLIKRPIRDDAVRLGNCGLGSIMTKARRQAADSVDQPAEFATIEAALQKLPRAQRRWLGNHPHEMLAILAKPAAKLDWVDLDTVISECAFDDGVRRLPAALRLVVAQPGEFPQLASAVVRFCKQNAAELAALQISDAAASLLRAAFFRQLDQFTGQRVQRERPPFDVWMIACVAGGSDRDHYLDDLRSAAIVFSNDKLVDQIANEWTSDFSHAARSAHFIDLCVQARYPESLQLKLYRSPPFENLVGDDLLVQQHWQSAAGVIRSQCPGEYVDWLVKEFNL